MCIYIRNCKNRQFCEIFHIVMKKAYLGQNKAILLFDIERICVLF